MKPYQAALLSAILAPGAIAHQVHGILLVNGTETPEWKYVRDVAVHEYMNPANYPGSEFPKTPPQMDVHNPNITCGRLAFDSAAKTETADVLAGSEVGFRVSWDGNGKYGGFYHPGPGQIYLSQAPNDDLESYRGDGDWFKIAYAGPVGSNKWMLWGNHERDWNFTIPATTPPGKYLMRIEHFMPTNMFNYSQWYVNCAHVNIIGPGGGTPTGFAKFPGTYEIDSPGLQIPNNQLVNGGYVADEDMRLLDYTPPGPAVWSG
ncbi:glycosyl hydrolase family 61-domain-containing protein [Parachaetomium inaequale]|uniref:lytic cellulose monooxygenase (C4-dehydrogenating) n=1 Tax=Parachaetomium inaequale TaxID=2588326 RepID=A0AAN6PDD1_9PEZI|nr:glycosyl hydrolase family 61-domain-containing protein [Parachaetomium inaequale]